MKFLLSLLTLVSALSLSAATRFAETSVSSVAAARQNANGDKVTPGTHRVHVGLRLGQPNFVQADGSWMYSNYVLQLGNALVIQPATLVVRFKDNHVSQLSLVDETTALALQREPVSATLRTVVIAQK